MLMDIGSDVRGKPDAMKYSQRELPPCESARLVTAPPGCAPDARFLLGAREKRRDLAAIL